MKTVKTVLCILLIASASICLAQTQLGSAINGAERDWLGITVAIAADGNRIAVGARGNSSIQQYPSTPQIDLSALPKGIYVVQVEVEGQWESQKLIKQ